MDDYMCWGMDEEAIDEIARQAQVSWLRGGKSVPVLLEFARLAKAAKDRQLVHFRSYFYLHRDGMQELLWEVVERELGLKPLFEDAAEMGRQATEWTIRFNERRGEKREPS